MRRGWMLVACVVTGVLPGIRGDVVAASPAALTSISQQVRWDGVVDGIASAAPACAQACDEFSFDVALPPQVWSRPGSVQVAIRWTDEGDDLDLSVYDAQGVEVARSHGTASTAESILMGVPANGTYRVVVFVRPEQLVEGRFTADVAAESVAYEGVVEVEYPPRSGRVRDLLPNLVSFPARNVTFSSGGYLFDPGISTASCYPDEMAEAGARRCLRFDQVIANRGAGPLELRYRVEDLATDQPVVQRIYRSDGSYRDRQVGTYRFHATHAHFHYMDFGQARLWSSNARAERLGDAPAAVGEKSGFCVMDIENFAFGRKGDGARTYFFEACNDPSRRDDGDTDIVTGISPGWADVYNWFLADQYIEVTNVPDGYYLLETIADAARAVVEQDESDNAADVLVRICGDDVDIVGETGRCGRSHP